jgi:hypothetical protein
MAETNFPGKIEISLSVGKEWAKKYRDSKEDEVKNKVDAYLIPLESLKLVLNQDIDAVRAYKGINDDGEQILMFVGTKLDEKTGIYVDVFPNEGNADATTGAVVYDGTRPCPPFGDPESPL